MSHEVSLDGVDNRIFGEAKAVLPPKVSAFHSYRPGNASKLRECDLVQRLAIIGADLNPLAE